MKTLVSVTLMVDTIELNKPFKNLVKYPCCLLKGFLLRPEIEGSTLLAGDSWKSIGLLVTNQSEMMAKGVASTLNQIPNELSKCLKC